MPIRQKTSFTVQNYSRRAETFRYAKLVARGPGTAPPGPSSGTWLAALEPGGDRAAVQSGTLGADCDKAALHQGSCYFAAFQPASLYILVTEFEDREGTKGRGESGR